MLSSRCVLLLRSSKRLMRKRTSSLGRFFLSFSFAASIVISFCMITLANTREGETFSLSLSELRQRSTGNEVRCSSGKSSGMVQPAFLPLAPRISSAEKSSGTNGQPTFCSISVLQRLSPSLVEREKVIVRSHLVQSVVAVRLRDFHRAWRKWQLH